MDSETRVDARSDDLTADATGSDLRESAAAREQVRHAELQIGEVFESLLEKIVGRKRRDGFGDGLKIFTATLGLDYDDFETLWHIFFVEEFKRVVVGRKFAGVGRGVGRGRGFNDLFFDLFYFFFQPGVVDGFGCFCEFNRRFGFRDCALWLGEHAASREQQRQAQLECRRFSEPSTHLDHHPRDCKGSEHHAEHLQRI